MFASKLHSINLMLCTAYCLAYYAINYIVACWALNRRKIGSLSEIKRVMCRTTVYMFIASLPLMPFVWESSVLMHFPPLITFMFLLSNMVWQNLILVFHYKKNFKDVLAASVVSNISAWALTGLCTYYFHYHSNLHERLLDKVKV